MQNLLLKLNRLNISLGVADNQLKIQAPKGLLTPELLKEIKLHKENLISFISMHKNEVIAAPEKIPKASLQDSYVLSSSQKRLWIFDQIENGNTAYNMPNVFKLEGDINIDALKKAFSALIERHEILRTQFLIDKSTNEPRQVIVSTEGCKFELRYYDLIDRKDELSDLLNKELTYTFDLSADVLFRVLLGRTAANNYVLCFVIHHIISDGWSSKIIMDDLFFLYRSIAGVEENELPALKIQYKDFATWQQDQLNSNTIDVHRKYWMDMFKDGVSLLDIPTSKPRPSVRSYKGKTINKAFDKNLINGFKALCKSSDATLFMGALAVVNTLLYKYTNQTDIIVGTPVAGRQHSDLYNQIGLYVNTLALKTSIHVHSTFADLLSDIRRNTLQAQEHQEYPFDELVQSLKIHTDRSRNPLFDVLLTVENKGAELNSAAGLSVTEVTHISDTSKFDLEFAFVEKNDGLSLLVTYNTDIYDEDFVIQIANHVENLLYNIIASSGATIESIGYISSEEKQKILLDFNNTAVDHPQNKTIDGLFEEQAYKTPNKIAVVFQEEKLTYQTLNEESNQLALYLKDQYDIKAGDLIGIKIERSEQLLVVIFGILKSRAAYVPIDINYPKARIEYIQENSKCKLVIDALELSHFKKVKDIYSKANQASNRNSLDLAYVIYTSGTTGHPKGVMITHNNAVALIHWAQDEFNKEAFEVTYAATSHCFDLSVYEMFYTLSVGKKVKILSNSLEIGKHLKSDEKVLLNTVPSSIRNILEEGYSLDNVSFINLAGEAFPVDIAPKLLSYSAEVRNLYGPTEDTTYSTCYKLSATNRYDFIPIGRPILNTQAYILDHNLQLLPIGVPGKLYLSGAGVARGYLKDEVLTNKKFIENPFRSGERVYDTGDIAKWLPDGNIMYLGRKDHQIKLRGFRIELKEIENAILAFSKVINQVVVVVKEVGGEQVLVAYIAVNEKLDKEALRHFLQEKLPSYMMPGHYVKLDSIPLTPNGKIDRKALPEITGESVIRKIYVGPRNTVEKLLVDIWQEVLEVKAIGITDNFFELGGNSLHFFKVLNKLTLLNKFHVNINILFTNLTIEKLAEKISNAESGQISTSTIIPKSKLQGPYFPLSPTQNRLWISSKIGGSQAYNIPLLIEINGLIDFGQFKEAIKMLFGRHDSLRTTFRFDSNNQIKQYVSPVDGFKFDFSLTETADEQHILKEVQKLIANDFDLENGPLLIAGAFKINEKRSIAYLVIHHLISDGWSMEIIFQEIVELFKSLVKKQPHNLPQLNIQYTDYAAWIDVNLETIVEKGKKFWYEIFCLPIPQVSLPFERKNRPLRKTYVGTGIMSLLSENLSSEIILKCKTQNVTNFAFMMSILKILLYKYTKQTDFTIGSPISGRFNQQIENQVGLYLNTLPIRSQFNEEDTFRNVILNENSLLIKYYDNQLFQMDDLIKNLDIKSYPGRSPLFDFMLIFQNQSNVGIFNNKDSIDNVKITPWDAWQYSHTQFDLVFSFSEMKSVIQYEVGYNKDIFEPQHVESLVNDYIFLAEHVLKNMDSKVNLFFEQAQYSFISDKPIVYELPENVLQNAFVRERGGIEIDERLRQELKGIITELLNADIEYHEDYFVKGGSSIGAIQIVNKVNGLYGKNYSIVDFYKNSSIDQFHDLILNLKVSEGIHTPDQDILVPLNEYQNDLPTLVFFPPILGVGLLFKPLSSLFTDKFNSYAINMPVLNEDVNESEIMQKWLDLIFPKVAEIITDAPIFLVGYSMGSNLAFEVAKRIEGQGKETCLFVIDRGPEMEKARMSKRLMTRTKEYHKELIDNALTFGIDEELINKRIEQSLKNQQFYSVEGVISSPIYAFKSNNDGGNNYMENWGKYTNDFKEIIYLEGNHVEALNGNNIRRIALQIETQLSTLNIFI